MSDPFVQRMMARSQARRQNKENAGVTEATRSRLQQINSLYGEETQPPPGPLRSSNSDLKGHQDFSPKKIAAPLVKEKLCSPSKSEGNTSPSRLRLNALEAQGFTPTESHSRLYYDFKKEQEAQTNGEPAAPVSPSKVKGMSLAEFMRNHSSPTKVTSPVKEKNKIASKPSLNQLNSVHANSSIATPAPPPPPVILTCHPKSPASSPVRTLSRVASPECKSKCNRRDVSPSKVDEMRSRWEQHIRDASPERVDRSRSPVKSRSGTSSPSKSYQSQSSSHIQAGSPVKLSSPSKNGNLSRLGSRDGKVDDQFREEYTSQADSSPKKVQGPFSRCGPGRSSHRDLSPHKPPPVGDIVKGEAPMPEAVPLVDEPFMSSVRARAAAFDSAGGNHSPEKDPAERSVQERRAIFNKNQGSVLVPKAPFGQSVPLKNLHADNAYSGDMASKTSVAHSHPVAKPTKKIAVEPSPAMSQRLQQFQRGRSPSPTKDENSVGMQRVRFENIKDNWRENEINSKIQTERQKEMDVLMNRFKRPKTRDNTSGSAQPPQCQPNYPLESETDYVESDESYAESTVSEETLRDSVTGPPKPPRLYLEGGSSGSSSLPSPPRREQSFSDCSPVLKVRSPAARLNSTEIDELHTSPKIKKEYMPKIKPGCIFPSLSDIESHSEAPDSQDEDDVQDSSFAESVLTCTSIESFGQKIKQMAQSNQTKILSSIAEQTESSSGIGLNMSENTMEAIDAIDNANILLPLSPTPNTKDCRRESSSIYKTPKVNPGSPGYNHDDENNLAHTISMYRKQKPDVACTPVRQITRHPDLRSPSPEPPESPSVTVSARIRELQEEVAEQQRVISQASNAVTVVLQHIEHQGTPQHVEAEKLLLLATQKRQTALDEIQRLKTEGALSQHSWAVSEDSCRGSISISNISVPLKREFIESGMNGHDVYHLIVLVKHREQVISSQLLATPSCVVDGSVTFPNLMSLHNLTSDFIISLEVYALRTSQARYSTIKKEQSRMKLTPLKRLQKSESRMASPSIQSPGGPYAVRSSSFQLVGFTHLNIATLTRNAWTLEKVPFSSPLDGHLLMRVSCSFEGGITERGFLTMFEDIGGFGAWNRRWCVLSGMFLRYWRYPDDESKKEANGQIDLRSCTTRRVELVSRDVCARQHTFQLTCLRPAYNGDVSNLVQEVQGSSVVTRHLLSADSKEERIVWCNKLNKSLANIRAWDPDALRPEDYQV
ncbi:anillin-like [Macrobrachium rosenbergii]|uniref:anillin-like n=1 Tax=Macrobrachium rosenbergii TaxID=79674 RepID=UPI0034D45130